MRSGRGRSLSAIYLGKNAVFWNRREISGGEKSALTALGNCHILPPHAWAWRLEPQPAIGVLASIGERNNLEAAIHVDGSAWERRLRLSADREECRRHGRQAVLFDFLAAAFAKHRRPSRNVGAPRNWRNRSGENERSNRSRKCRVSFAPLGHGLSGGLFMRAGCDIRCRASNRRGGVAFALRRTTWGQRKPARWPCYRCGGRSPVAVDCGEVFAGNFCGESD